MSVTQLHPRTASSNRAGGGRTGGPQIIRTDSEIAGRAAKHILYHGVARHTHTGKPTADPKGSTRQPVCIARALERAAAGQKTDRVKDRLHYYLTGLGLGGMATYVDLYLNPEASPSEVKQQVAGMLQEFAAHCARQDSRQTPVEPDVELAVAA